jgi:hypothetical protein
MANTPNGEHVRQASRPVRDARQDQTAQLYRESRSVQGEFDGGRVERLTGIFRRVAVNGGTAPKILASFSAQLRFASRCEACLRSCQGMPAGMFSY